MITRDDIEAQARELEEAVRGLIRSSMVKASVGLIGKGAASLSKRKKAAGSNAAEAEERIK